MNIKIILISHSFYRQESIQYFWYFWTEWRLNAFLPMMPVMTRRKRSRRNARTSCFSGVANAKSALFDLISSCSVIFCPGNILFCFETDATRYNSWRSQHEDRVRELWRVIWILTKYYRQIDVTSDRLSAMNQSLFNVSLLLCQYCKHWKHWREWKFK